MDRWETEPVAIHTFELDDRLAFADVHRDGRLTIRRGSDGHVLARTRLRTIVYATSCATLDGAPTLFAVCGERLIARNLMTGTTVVIANGVKEVHALATGWGGDRFVVALSRGQGTVALFTTLGGGHGWTSVSADVHRNAVTCFAIGSLDSTPVIVSFAEDASVAVTRLDDRAIRAFWSIRWRSGGVAASDHTICTWRNEGLEAPPDNLAFPVDITSGPILVHLRNERLQRMAELRRGEMIDLGRTSVVVIAGDDDAQPMVAVGDLPRPDHWCESMMALPVPGRLIASRAVRGGVALAFARDSVIHVELLEIHVGRRLKRHVLASLLAAGATSPYWAVPESSHTAKTAATALLLVGVFILLTVWRQWREDFRLCVRQIRRHRLASIDLHSDVADVDFDGDDGLVVLTRSGVAALAFSLPQPLPTSGR